MAYKQTKADKICIVGTILSFIGFLYLVFFVSWWCLFFAPFYFLIGGWLTLWIATGKRPQWGYEKIEGERLETQIMNQGMGLEVCAIYIQPDILMVRSANNTTKIPFESLSSITTDVRKKGDNVTAGFEISFEDKEGSGRMMFFNTNLFSELRTSKQVEKIRSAHAAYYKDCRVPALDVIDIPKIKKAIASQVVHRGL